MNEARNLSRTGRTGAAVRRTVRNLSAPVRYDCGQVSPAKCPDLSAPSAPYKGGQAGQAGQALTRIKINNPWKETP